MSGLYLPGAVVPQRVTTWAAASAWLYSWVRTDHPGYRTVKIDGVPFTLPSSTYRWDDYIAAVDTLTAAYQGYSIESGGRIAVSDVGSYSRVTYDRMGWLMGLGVEAGATITSAAYASAYVPPGGIPLLGATWDEVSLERERELVTDRSRRQSGYVFGGARVWRFRLTMTRFAYEALAQGWCLRGKVSLVGSTSSAMSASTPAGVLSGYVLGLDGAPVWDGPTQEICRATLLVAGTTT